MCAQIIKKVILAYSGGLDTSAIIPWLKENYTSEVIAFVADVGQNREELEHIEEKALQSGASMCIIKDLRKELVENYIFPVLQSGALYEGKYLLGTALARPIIAKSQIDLAFKLGADGLCHGSTGKGNDQIRFESVYAALAPNLKVIAPWRKWNFHSRKELLIYLKNKNIKTTASLEKIYSRDENIWHISTEGGCLENLWNKPIPDCWVWTVDPKKSPNNSEFVSIKIERGMVTEVNDKLLSPLACLSKLNSIGSKHGIGRIDIVENRIIGMKSRGCYETPGGTILINALQAIEQLVLDRESLKWRQQVGLEMSYVIYNGGWFSPLRRSLQAAIKELSLEMTGEVVLELYKGTVTAVKKFSPNTLYSKAFATFSTDNVYTQSDANGFIKLFSLSSKIRAMNKTSIIKK